MMPCTKVANALATGRPFVKFEGQIDDDAVVVEGGRVVTFLADPGAKLTRSVGTGAIVTVKDNGTSLSIYDLSISDAPNNASGFGVVIPTASGAPTVSLTHVTLTNNPGGGISVSGGSFTVTRSTISGNQGGGISASGGTLTVTRSTISGNQSGGIAVSGAQFDITNNFIVQNGSPTALAGGINFAAVSGAGTRRLEFNTIAANAGTATVNSGVNCGTIGAPITFSNNIIFANTVTGGGSQLGGSVNCQATFSDIGPDMTAGTGNINIDPMFVNIAQNDFHLASGSPCKDAADPAASLAVDLDGDARPQGSARDVGADEIRP